MGGASSVLPKSTKAAHYCGRRPESLWPSLTASLPLPLATCPRRTTAHCLQLAPPPPFPVPPRACPPPPTPSQPRLAPPRAALAPPSRCVLVPERLERNRLHQLTCCLHDAIRIRHAAAARIWGHHRRRACSDACVRPARAPCHPTRSYASYGPYAAGGSRFGRRGVCCRPPSLSAAGVAVCQARCAAQAARRRRESAEAEVDVRDALPLGQHQGKAVPACVSSASIELRPQCREARG